MSLTNLHDLNIISLPKKEQALAWLIENGPIVAAPDLPRWMLMHLTDEERVMRLRRGLYLVPTPEGTLPKLPQVIEGLDHGGYISGQGALFLHGLNDQEVGEWFVVSARRQADIHYGPYRVHFVFSPEQAAKGVTKRVKANGEPVTVATVAQAFVDELRYAPFGLDYQALARVLGRAVASGQIKSSDIVALLRRSPSVPVARRAGFLFQLIGQPIDEQLLAIANTYRGPTDAEKYPHIDKTWRIGLPKARTDLARAIRW